MSEELERDGLEDFLEAEGDAGGGPTSTQIVRDLLIFEYGGEHYAVLARDVAGVVPWRMPVPVPGTDDRIHGVVQDRGRIVVILAHPAGRSGKYESERKRIVICSTPRGMIGLPAGATRAVGPVELREEPAAFTVFESGYGVVTYLEPASLVEPARQRG